MPRSAPALSVALLVLVTAALTVPVAAWHFAFGTISWQLITTNRSSTGVLQNYYNLTFQQGWNSSWHWCSSGFIVSPKPCSGKAIAVGNLINTGNAGTGNNFYLNDITPGKTKTNVNSYNGNLPVRSTVTKLFPLDVVFQASSTVTVGPLIAANSFMVVFTMCCRVDYLWGPNRGSNVAAYVSATIVPNVTYSFNTTNPPRTYAYVNEPVPFAIAVSALNPGQIVRYSFTPIAYSGLVSPVPPNMTLDANTGVVNWTTSVVGVFPVQFMITDVNTGFYIVLDTLIQTFPPTAHPVFASLPSQWSFATSVEGVYTVTVNEDDPKRTLTVNVAGGPTTATFSLQSTVVTRNSTTSTYAYRWTPGADDYSQTVCFQAYDDLGFYNSGNLCVTLLVQIGDLLVLSGTVRDFHNPKSGGAIIPDFNNTNGGDTTMNFALSTITSDATNRVPVFNTSVATVTTTAAHFAQWWTTDGASLYNQAQSMFLLLANNTSATVNGDSRVYTYSTSSFWPVDSQLFGNEGDAHNRYFTWEAHTYLTYMGGEVLTFKSNDDLWVYVNGQLPVGWNMHGVRTGAPRSFALSLDTMFNRTTDINTTVPVDIFYAHRSSVNDAALQIQLVAASLCNALSTGVSQIRFGALASAPGASPLAPSLYVQGQASIITVNGQQQLQLMPANAAYSIGLAYFGDSAGPKRLKISHGFKLQFSFIGSGPTDGFAVIFHADSPYTWGGAGGNLGYAGAAGIKNSIAIEFDGLSTNGNGDPSWNHVSVHSQWTAANSAIEPGLGGLYSSASPSFAFFNNTQFDVTVLYTAPVVGSGQQTGAMQVSFAGVNTPILVAPIDATLLTQIWDGSAYVGFTAGSGDTVYNSIRILNVSMIAIPASATNSYIPAGGAPSPSSDCQAGDTVTMVVKLRDSCNNDMTIGGDEADVTATMRYTGTLTGASVTTGPTISGIVKDANNDGSYQISFSPTVAGYYSISVQYGGNSIATSAYTYAVYPGAANPSMSYFNYSFEPAPTGQPHINVNSLLINITTRDSYGNLITYGRDVYTVSFVPDVLSSTVYPAPVWDAPNSVYRVNLTANLAVSSQLYITLASSDLSFVTNIANVPAAFTFLPGPASSATSTLQASSSLSGAIAGSVATFTVMLRDAQGNLISSDQSDTVSYSLQLASNPAVSVSGQCQWAAASQAAVCSYSATVAGVYALSVTVNGGAMTGLSSTSLTVSAAAVDPSQCQLTFYFASTGVQLSNTSLTLTSDTVVTVSATSYDSYGNLQSNGLNAGVVNQATATFTTSLSPVAGMTVSSFATSNNYWTYTALLSGNIAQNYSLTVRLGAVEIRGSPVQVTIVPGAASALSFVDAISVVSTVSAGSVVRFTLVSVDVEGNNRSQGGAGTDYAAQLLPVTGSGVTAVAINSSSNHLFPVAFSTTVAGNYTVAVQVRATGSAVIGSPFPVTVTPGATSPSTCTASGDGYYEGITGTVASFAIQAADAFGNAQWSWLHSDFFLIIITNQAQQNTSFYANSTTLFGSTPGLYSASYVVPDIVNSGMRFAITVFVRDSEGQYQPIGTPPSLATILPSNTTLSTVINGPDFPTGQIGRINTWFIQDTSASTPAVALSVTVSSSDGSVNFVSTARAVSSGSRNYSLSFTPNFRLPTDSSVTFAVNVSRAGFQSMTPPDPVTFVAGTPVAANCKVTGLPAAALHANTPVSFVAELYDTVNNRITAQPSASPIVTVMCASTPATVTSGATSYTMTGVWDNTSLSYSLTVTPTTACVYSIQVLLGDEILSARSYSMTVVPAAPSATYSSVTSASSALAIATTAGASVSITIILADAYGNLIDPSTASVPPTILLTISVSDDTGSFGHPTSVGAVSYAQSLGRFTAQLTPFHATSGSQAWSVAVSLSSSALINSPLPLTVAPATIANSAITAPIQSVAGQPIITSITLYDTYGNSWLSVPSLSLIAYIALPSLSLLTAPHNNPSNDYVFRTTTNGFALIINSTQQAGNYVITLRCNGASLTASATITVLPEAVDVTQSIVNTALQSIVAGTVDTLYLQLRDQYDNLITDATLASWLSFSLYSWSGTFTCDNSLWNDDTMMPEAVDSDAYQLFGTGFNASTSQFYVRYAATLAGRFTVNVTVNGTALPCLTLLPALAQTVTAAEPSASASVVVGVPASSIAGTKIALTVELYDQYGNTAVQGQYAVAVDSSARSLQGSFSSVTSDYAGRYFLTATPTLAAYVNTVVTLDGAVLATRDAYGNATNATFPVSPAMPASIVVTEVPSYITAAIPFTVQFHTVDAYNNFLGTANSWYELQWSIYGQTLSPSEYTFTGQSSIVTGTNTYFLQSDSRLQWLATSDWNGRAFLQVSVRVSGATVRSSVTISTAVNIFINGSACAVDNPSRPYRCSDGSCVVRYSECPSATLCPSTTPVLCAGSLTCASSVLQCPCPPGQSRCAINGQCVANTVTQCFPANTACPAGLAACTRADGSFTGDCRYNVTSCPSTAVCPPSYALCPDLLTCVVPGDSCADYATQGGSGAWAGIDTYNASTFRCNDGRFVSAISDCGTPKSCPAGYVLCLTDQSCQMDAALCPAPYQCYSALSFRCPDGSCRSTAKDCPRSISCPVGWARCEDDSCAQSLSECLPSFNCSLSQVRCSDGSCAVSPTLCPSTLSCPLAVPVKCSDGSCVSSASFCALPSLCPSAENGARCPDGSCVQAGAACPTAHSCPRDSPVLCPDTITCVADVERCPAVQRCQAPNVVKCSDGSCRRAAADCPTALSCPPSKPVRCTDGSCALSVSLCANMTACPAAKPVRCGGGECMASYELCPTHVTCSAGTSRCPDGSCRFSCPKLVQLTCANGLVPCPQASSGLQCVASLTQCPQQVICPAAAPVRCVDASCATASSACPALTVDPPSTLLPCPDGSWTVDVTTCGTLVSCPAAFPFKCLDESCRLSPADCVTPAPCANASVSDSATFRCPNGGCVSQLTDAQCQTNTKVKCPTTRPYKCAGAGESCVVSPSQCTLPPFYTQSTPTVSSSGTLPVASICPTGFLQCRDGSCVSELASCPASATCPVYLPTLCASGVCASNSSACPDAITGCYPLSSAPHACWNGLCVASASQCPPVPTTCENYCIDGSCPPASITTAAGAASWCEINGHSCSLYCADGTCGIAYNDATSTNLCTAGGVLSGFGTPLHPGLGNVCPSWAPHRCDNGLCVVSSLNCTALIDFYYCERVSAATPYQCANGDCVVSAIQCPVIYPCPTGENRCGDGTCRLAGTCPPSANSCPTMDASIAPLADGSNRRPRCANGLCSSGLDLSQCPDLSIGCPSSTPIRCPNGACIAGTAASCANVTLQSSGCPAATPYKCSNGACAASAPQCTLPNNCPVSTPYRCVDGDGSCQSSIAACNDAPYNVSRSTSVPRCIDGSSPVNGVCLAANGCPATAPWRCASGNCRKYPATAAVNPRISRDDTCPLTVQCPAPSQVLCADGSCAATLSLCPSSSVFSCSAPTPVLCPDLSCAASWTACADNSRSSVCPTAVPIACDSGACVSSQDQCYIYTVPGVSSGGLQPITANNGANTVTAANTSSACVGTASLSSAPAICPSSLSFACFDGSCRDSWAACQLWAMQASGVSLAAANITQTQLDQQSESLCDATEVLCPSGYCAPAVCDRWNLSCVETGCGIVAACSPGTPVRCPDGRCVTTIGACPSMPACPAANITGYVGALQTRCEDGACRLACLPFDGCPLVAPYQCPNRECATSADQCSAVAVGSMFMFDVTTDLEQYLPTTTSMRRLLAVSDNGSGALTKAAAVSCWSQCWAQLKASTLSVALSVAQSSTLTLAVDGYQIVESSLVIPANALVITNASSVAYVSVNPVPESRMRDAENRMPASRADEFGSAYLTFTETVLSPAFDIAVDSRVQQPFQLGLQMRAPVDLPTGIDWSDICLGRLVEYPVFGFAYWTCVLDSKSDRLASPVYNATRDAGIGTNVATGYISRSGTYAFILSPLTTGETDGHGNFIVDNLLIIVLCLAGGVAFIVAVFYVFKRLHRYRAKYHGEREAVAAKREEVAEMEMFGGAAGRKDEEVQMTQNPIVRQLEDVALASKHANVLAALGSGQATKPVDEVKLDPELASFRAQQRQHREQHIRSLEAELGAYRAEMEQLESLIGGGNSASYAAARHKEKTHDTEPAEALTLAETRRDTWQQ